MRRDYFTCVFLLFVMTSLLFVCFSPLYYTYDGIVARDIGIFERITSLLFSLIVLFVVPIFAAVRKKFWITAGAATYGLLAYIPSMFMPSAALLSGNDASMLSLINAFILKAIYRMVNAPFAGVSKLIGGSASKLSKWILPLSLGIYVTVQLYRFYRDAYTAEQLDPSSVVDVPRKTNEPAGGVRTVKVPEVLGTVISAPQTASRNIANNGPRSTISNATSNANVQTQRLDSPIRTGNFPPVKDGNTIVADKTPNNIGITNSTDTSNATNTTRAQNPKDTPNTPFDGDGVIHL